MPKSRQAKSRQESRSGGERAEQVASLLRIVKEDRSQTGGRKRRDPNWDHLHVTVPTNVKLLVRGYCDRMGVRQQDLILALLADFFVAQGFALTDLYGLTLPPDAELNIDLLQEFLEAGASTKDANGRSAAK